MRKWPDWRSARAGNLAAAAVVLPVVLASMIATPAASAASWIALASSNTQYLPDDGAPLTPVNLGTDTADPSITLDNFGGDVVISPDGRTGFAVSSTYFEEKPCQDNGPSDIQEVDLTGEQPVASGKIDLGSTPPIGLAIAPDGQTLYASSLCADAVIPIDLTQHPAVVGSPIAVGKDPFTVVVSPDGRTLYAANTSDDTVSVVDLAAAPAKQVATVATGSRPIGMAITPDGSKLFVADSGECVVTEIDTATRTPHTIKLEGSSCKTGDAPERLAISPDGATAYVTVPDAQALTPITIAGDSPQPAVSLAGIESFKPGGIAVTPDGKEVVVGDVLGSEHGPFGEQVEIIEEPGNHLTASPIPFGAPPSTPTRIAITPDQAPVANFTVASAPPGSPTGFDASSSSVRFGSIVSFEWDFGDGTHQTTTAPLVEHTYKASGEYTATVTETDNIGTSTGGEIFTGQSASVVGGPSARTSRSVVISSAAQPALSLSTASINFGAVGIGRSVARTLTVLNTGKGPLTISGSALAGLGAPAFSLSADKCTGATLAPGAACSVTVVLDPLAAGSFVASLALTDNASGSPHTIALEGSGVSYGLIVGRISDASHRPATPLAGASVSACLSPGFRNCRDALSAADGSYEFANLAAGQYTMEVFPPGGALRSASATVAVSTGAARQDFGLTAPVPLSGGVAFETPGGTVATGTPTVNWNEPFSFDVPVKVPAHGTPDSVQPVIIHGSVALDSGSAGGGGFGLAANENLLVAYGSSGTPSGIVGVEDSTPAGNGAEASGKGSEASETFKDIQKVLEAIEVKTGPNSEVTVTVKAPLGDSGYEGEVVVKVVPNGNPPFSITVRPPKGPKIPKATSCPVPLTPEAQRIAEEVREKTEEVQKELTKLAAEIANKAITEGTKGTQWAFEQAIKGAVAANELLEKAGGQLTERFIKGLSGSGQSLQGRLNLPRSPLGAISAAVGAFEPQMSSQLLINGTAASVLAQTHPAELPLNAGPVLVRFTVPALEQRVHGAFNWRYRTRLPSVTFGPSAKTSATESGEACKKPPVEVVLEGEEEEEDEEGEEGGGGGGYIDPSGSVKTTGGVPVSGARVMLLRSASKKASAKRVANGSAVMSPANRRNPDTTDALGQFGWDVLPGFYEVRVSRPGCGPSPGHPLASRLFAVPPPVIDISFKLRCPHLKRSATKVTLLAAHGPGRTAGFLVRVHSSRGHPVGFVIFRAGSRTLGRGVLDSRSGTAAFEARVAPRTRVTAIYMGDASHRPGRGSALVRPQRRRASKHR